MIATDIKKISKELAQVIRALYFPMTEKQKQEYMQRIEEKRDFYQPKMEAKIGVSLGKVYVLPNILRIQQEIYDCYIAGANFCWDEKIQKKSKLERGLLKTTASFFAAPIVAALGSVLAGIVLFQGIRTDMAAGNESIRVPFGLETRMNLFRERKRKETHLDEYVVHELSHILWDRLENKEKNAGLISRELTEGFATYCHEEYFAEFYPIGYRQDLNLVGGIYKSGKMKIKELVNQYGEKILLKIPSMGDKARID